MAKIESIGFGKRDAETKEIVTGGEVTFNMPETIEEAVNLWGEEVVLSKCIANVVVDIQAMARKHDDVDAAQAALDSWVPGVARTRGSGGSSKTAMMKKVKEMNPDELKELLAKAGIEI